MSKEHRKATDWARKSCGLSDYDV